MSTVGRTDLEWDSVDDQHKLEVENSIIELFSLLLHNSNSQVEDFFTESYFTVTVFRDKE